MPEERPQATKRSLQSLDLRRACGAPIRNCLEILINLNLDSTILRSTLGSLVISDRFGFAKPLTRDRGHLPHPSSLRNP